MFHNSISAQVKTKKLLEYPNTIKYLFCYSKNRKFNFGGGFISLYTGSKPTNHKGRGENFTKKGALPRAPFLVVVIPAKLLLFFPVLAP